MKARSKHPILALLDTLLIAFVLYTFGAILIFSTVTITAFLFDTSEVYQRK